MPLATEHEASREYARNYGMDHPEQAWVLTHMDAWERNPFYTGPAVRHPEDDSDYDDQPAPTVVYPSYTDEIPF